MCRLCTLYISCYLMRDYFDFALFNCPVLKQNCAKTKRNISTGQELSILYLLMSMK